MGKITIRYDAEGNTLDLWVEASPPGSLYAEKERWPMGLF